MQSSGAFKAKLKIKLYADEKLIVESEDSNLWQYAMSRILHGSSDEQNYVQSHNTATTANVSPPSHGSHSGSDPVLKFASEIGITVEEAQGACQPSLESPYITLNKRNWENFIRSTPSRGTGSVSKLGLVGALLCLWHDCAGLEEEPRVSDCQRILKTIKLFEANPTRSFENSPWLMKRGRGISINPARTSHALEIAKNYCTANTIKG